MYTKIKRAVSFMTGAVMLCSMSPVPIRFSEPITANAAESDFPAEQTVTKINAEASPTSGKIGDNLTWTLDESGTMTISGTGAMVDSEGRKNSVSMHEHPEEIKSIVIEDGVTSIGNYMFADYKWVTSVTIPDSVTKIGYVAFDGCTSLTDVTIPDTVTTIGGHAFSDTPWVAAQQTNNQGAVVNGILINASQCSGDVVIPDGVRIIGDDAFYRCYELTGVTIPDSVTSIGAESFLYCEKLNAITIPDSVTNIGHYAFKSCSSLKDITLPNSLTYIGVQAFAETPWLAAKQEENPLVIESNILIDGTGCSGEVTIPDGVKRISWSAFSAAKAVTDVTVPASVTTIGNSAFQYCSNLITLTILGNDTRIDDTVFYDCKKMTIRGYAGSFAETYAKEHKIPFEVISELQTGDVTGDGVISIEDAQLALNAYVDIMAGMESTLTAEQFKAADVSGDNIVSIDDAQMILNYYVLNTVSDISTTWGELLAN